MMQPMARLKRWVVSGHRVLLASSKQSIMWLLMLLVGLFFTGMWVLSSLNLDHAQQALAELRRAQIEQTFLANVQRINARQRMIEQYTASLARSGEQFYREWVSEQRLSKTAVEQALQTRLKEYFGVRGVGLWYETGMLAAENERFAPYIYRVLPDRVIPLMQREAGGDNYRRQPWYPLAFGNPLRDEGTPERHPYWTPVYFNSLTDNAVLTVVFPMFSPSGELIGMATTDWESEEVIDLVSRIEVTPNSFSFLIDRNNRKLSSLSRDDALEAEQILDAVVEQQLATSLPPTPPMPHAPVEAERMIQTRTLAVAGREYVAYFAGTPAGMLFGVGVPRDEIDAVLKPMRDSNYQILTLVGLILLVLAGWLIYRIRGLMQELQASYTDALTGLPNRVALLQELDRSNGATLALINLDRFKEVNSLFGHDCGDQVLRTLARDLSDFIAEQRRGRYVTLYRVTGDEFALIGPPLTNERLRGLIQPLSEFLQRQRVYWQDQEIGIGATIGVAGRRSGTLLTYASSDGERPDSLLSQATVALKSARQHHLNYQIYDTGQQVERLYEDNLVWARRLKAGLQENRILPWFQPIRDNRSGQVAKFECLVRLEELDGSIVSPSKFLDVAHRLRLDRQITRIMVEKSFAAFRDCSGTFSLNISYADLQDAELVEFITERLASSGLGPRVIFEVLESDGLGNYSEMRRFIDEVKPYGCRIAIDDFGTGYSNFEHLLRLNVDLIKIDGSLIRHLHEDRTAWLVTQGIVQFARSLGISTVAEFVHNVQVYEKVLELGIDYSQGSYIGMAGSRPVVEASSGSGDQA